MSYNIILGSAFLNSFYAEFEYNTETNVNVMELTLALHTIDGTSLGNQTADSGYTPTPTPEPAPPTPSPVPIINDGDDTGLTSA